jgi:hypothetical protein
MTISQADSAVYRGCVVGVITILNILLWMLFALGGLPYWEPKLPHMTPLVDVTIFSLLVIGLSRKSRVCAILLIVCFVLEVFGGLRSNRFAPLIPLVALLKFPIALLFLFFYVQAFRGTLVLRARPDPRLDDNLKEGPTNRCS